MTQLQFLTGWVMSGAGVAFWTCALWPGITAVFWPWWRHQWGLNMVIKTELIALGLLATVLHREFGVMNVYVLLWTTAVAVTLIPVVVAWRTVLIWRGQRDGARAGAEKPGAREPGPVPLRGARQSGQESPPPRGGGFSAARGQARPACRRSSSASSRRLASSSPAAASSRSDATSQSHSCRGSTGHGESNEVPPGAGRERARLA